MALFQQFDVDEFSDVPSLIGRFAPEQPKRTGIMAALSDPRVVAMLSGASKQLLAAGAPSLTPKGTGVGAALGAGFGGAIEGAQSYEEQLAKQAAESLRQKMEERKLAIEEANAQRGGQWNTDLSNRYRLAADRFQAEAKAKGVDLPREEADQMAQKYVDEMPYMNRADLEAMRFGFAKRLEELKAGLAPKVAGDVASAEAKARAWTAKELSMPTDVASAENLIEQLGETRKTVQKALGQSDWTTTGLVGSMLSFIPGSDAYDLDATLQTVRSNLGLDTLVAIKQQGGTLGAVSEKELDLLLSKVANLRQAQGTKQFKEQLGEVLRMYDRTVRNIENDVKIRYGKDIGSGKQPAKQPSTPSSSKNLRSKYGL